MRISTNFIIRETGRATLFKMPHNSDFDGFQFWFPSKLVKGESKQMVTLSFSDNFNFNLKKYGKGKYNKFEVVDECTIDSDTLLEAFGGEAAEVKPIVHVPEPVAPVNAHVISELKDDD